MRAWRATAFPVSRPGAQSLRAVDRLPRPDPVFRVGGTAGGGGTWRNLGTEPGDRHHVTLVSIMGKPGKPGQARYFLFSRAWFMILGQVLRGGARVATASQNFKA